MASEPGSGTSNLDTASKPEPTAPDTSPTSPISPARLEEIVTEACTTTLQFSDSYQHAQVGKWNTSIIQSALSLLIGDSTSHKFIVTSTIIQHTTPPAPFSPKVGWRGSEKKGFDVIVTVFGSLLFEELDEVENVLISE
ncbi:chondroitin AC/alginate lyase [Physcia stellaris]|nr:chondroitin AC/alginate lyase [Physcia stellaris]